MQLAYLDAGSGSLIASAVVGGGAAALVAFRSAGSKVTRVFSRKRKADEGDAPEDVPEHESANGDGEAATESTSAESEAVNTAPSDS